MEGLRRPTKSRQGAKPNSAKPTQVGSSTRRLSCVARQRLPIPSILSILSHSTPHPQPPHLYKCGGSAQAPFFITDTRTPSWLLHSAADILPNHGGVAAEIKFDFGPRIYHHIYINAVVAHRRPSSPAASTPPSRAAASASPQVFSFSQVPSCTPHSDRITSTVSQGSVPRNSP